MCPLPQQNNLKSGFQQRLTYSIFNLMKCARFLYAILELWDIGDTMYRHNITTNFLPYYVKILSDTSSTNSHHLTTIEEFQTSFVNV